MTTTRRAGHAGILLMALSLALSACSTTAGPGPASATPPATPPSAAPSGNGSSGNVGALPPDSPIVGQPPVGGGQPGDPGTGQPNLVVPKPGTIDPHPVGIGQLVSQVDGRHVLLNARWWSGVEPCNVLDSVKVARSGDTFTVTVFEGAGQADAICIDIAMEKVTVIDLGELDPGTYIVQASHGDAAAITVVVP